MIASDTRNDPTNSGSRCISDNGDFPGHFWTWTGGWRSIQPDEESWICYRCGAESTTRTRTERPCASCANPYGHRYCGLLCGSGITAVPVTNWRE
jgi:hypothetical protein